MSERMCWSTDPFLRDVRITDADRATVRARERWQPGDLIRAQMGDYGVIDHWQHAVCPDPITHPEGECDR